MKYSLARVVVAATSVALVQPGAAQPAPSPPAAAPRHGLTFEAGLGVGGLLSFGNANGADPMQGGHVSADLGVTPGVALGVWEQPRLAVTVRIAGVIVARDGGFDTNAFIGPAFQFWINDRLWSGGGVGLGYLQASSMATSFPVNATSPYSALGFAMHFRVGYTFNPCSANAVNASFELDPGFYTEPYNASWTFMSVGFLVGYQYM